MLLVIVIPIFSIGCNNKAIEQEDTNLDSSQGESIDKNQDKKQDDMSILSSFSTSYMTSGVNRATNVEIATKRLDKVEVRSKSEFSFNSVVGKRNYENGFKDALVIDKGVYVKGVGGGVCQVSTTLYNAWILAGLSVKSVKNHTIPTSYVDLSRDATVSDYIDLVLYNDSDNSVFIDACTKDKNVCINILGKAIDYTIELKTDIVEEIPIPDAPPIIIDVDRLEDEEDITYKGALGYKSMLTMNKIKNGEVVESKKLREDYYPARPNQRVVKRFRLD